MHTLILGFDAFHPGLFERLSGEGKLPHLTRYAEAGGYARFAVANPPQSEVSWTSIATGLNPGGHGIFDFVHRDPASYALIVSLLPTQRGLAGTQFVPPSRAQTIFDEAARLGYPATALWWPGGRHRILDGACAGGRRAQDAPPAPRTPGQGPLCRPLGWPGAQDTPGYARIERRSGTRTARR
jgi:hypothetical protein